MKSFDINLFTCQDHSLVEALLESAELTPVSLHLVDFTVSVCHASVDPKKNMKFYLWSPCSLHEWLPLKSAHLFTFCSGQSSWRTLCSLRKWWSRSGVQSPCLRRSYRRVVPPLQGVLGGRLAGEVGPPGCREAAKCHLARASPCSWSTCDDIDQSLLNYNTFSFKPILSYWWFIQ